MPRVQARIIRATCLLPLAALTIMTAAVTILCRKVIAEAAEYEAVLPHLELLLQTIVVLTTTMVAAILYVAFRFSHRVTGPSYRIIQTLKEAPENPGLRARLRRGDFLGEVAEQLNETLGVFHQRAEGGAVAPAAAGDDAASEPGTGEVAEMVGAGADSRA